MKAEHIKTAGVNDHAHSGWLGFCRQRRQKKGARSALIVENNAVKPWKRVQSTRIHGLENPIGHRLFSPVLAPLMQNRPLTGLLAAVTALQLAFTATGIAAWQCPIHSTLGVAGPGCGLTRAMIMFVQGHWQESIQLHAFAPIFLVVGILFAAGSALPQKLRCRVAGRLAAFERRTAISALLLVSALIYWVLRTIAHI